MYFPYFASFIAVRNKKIASEIGKIAEYLLTVAKNIYDVETSLDGFLISLLVLKWIFLLF